MNLSGNNQSEYMDTDLVSNSNSIEGSKKSNTGILILGIIGFFTSWSVLGVIPAIVAIVIAIKRLRSKNYKKRWKIFVSLILGIAACLFFIVISAKTDYNEAQKNGQDGETSSYMEENNLHSTQSIASCSELWEIAGNINEDKVTKLYNLLFEYSNSEEKQKNKLLKKIRKASDSEPELLAAVKKMIYMNLENETLENVAYRTKNAFSKTNIALEVYHSIYPDSQALSHVYNYMHAIEKYGQKMDKCISDYNLELMYQDLLSAEIYVSYKLESVDTGTATSFIKNFIYKPEYEYEWVSYYSEGVYDSDYMLIVATDKAFEEEGLYWMTLHDTGEKKSLVNSKGFEFSAPLFEMISDDNILLVHDEYWEYANMVYALTDYLCTYVQQNSYEMSDLTCVDTIEKNTVQASEIIAHVQEKDNNTEYEGEPYSLENTIENNTVQVSEIIATVQEQDNITEYEGEPYSLENIAEVLLNYSGYYLGSVYAISFSPYSSPDLELDEVATIDILDLLTDEESSFPVYIDRDADIMGSGIKLYYYTDDNQKINLTLNESKNGGAQVIECSIGEKKLDILEFQFGFDAP